MSKVPITSLLTVTIRKGHAKWYLLPSWLEHLRRDPTSKNLAVLPISVSQIYPNLGQNSHESLLGESHHHW